MRKIGTRLATIVLLLVVAVSFSACSLFTTDLDKKYNADSKVLTIANADLSVSRQELYHAYSQWGYQYASSFKSTDELLKYISEGLLNDKIMEQRSLEQFGALRDAEEALALKQAYASMDQTIRAYVYEALNLEDKDEDSENTTDEDKEVDKPYTPSINVNEDNGDRVYTLNLTSHADEDGVGALQSKDYAYYIPQSVGVASLKNMRQAISKIVRNLQAIESGFTKLKTPERDYLQATDEAEPKSDYFKYLTKTERTVLNREIDRMVKANRTSILVNRLNTAYDLGFFTLKIDNQDQLAQAYQQAWNEYLERGTGTRFDTWCEMINGIDTGKRAEKPSYYGCGKDIATNRAHKAIEKYRYTVDNAIVQQSNFPKDDLEANLVSSGLADVYYIPQDVANNLFTVSHILVGFTDEQQTEYKRIQDEAVKNPSYNAQNDLNKLYVATMSDGVSADKIYGEVKTALEKVSSEQEKYRIFREYINKYNTDPGMQNLDQLSSSSKPQYEYLMSTTEANNKMVAEFTKASLALKDAKVKGAISQIVWSEYGAHIIMYTRDVSDFIFTAVAGTEKEYNDKLFATLTSYGKRTMFDVLVDNDSRDYSEFREKKLNEYKQEHTVTFVTSEFKDFLKK